MFIVHYLFGPTNYNNASGLRRKDESGVKGVKVLAVVGTTMSKRFWDTGVRYVIKGEEIYKDKATGLGVRGK